MARFKDQAVCIGLSDWSETSQIVTLLTEQHGVIRGLARGARRTSPSHLMRFSGGLELLSRGEVVATTKPSTDLATITEWDLQATHPHLRGDYPAQQFAFVAAALAGAFIRELDPHPRTHHALLALLQALVEREGSARHQALLAFQWRLLDDAGYRPELHQDVLTHAPLTDERAYHFLVLQGGLTTQGPPMDAGPAWRVRRETVTLLRAQAAALDDQPRAPAALPGSSTPPDRPHASSGPDGLSVIRANRLLCAYARALLDRELPAMRFLLNDASAGGEG